MYTVIKTLTISAAHFLPRHEGKCKRLHGHNWKVTAHCRSPELNANGMVVDFGRIKRTCETLDHRNINDVFEAQQFDYPPTAEVIAKYLCDMIPFCFKVEVEENDGSVAIYEEPEEE